MDETLKTEHDSISKINKRILIIYILMTTLIAIFILLIHYSNMIFTTVAASWINPIFEESILFANVIILAYSVRNIG